MNSAEQVVILIVDDEEIVRNIVRRALEAEGCRLLVAASGLEALELCHEEAPIHLAILDMVMPGMNGPAVLDCLRELFSNIRVLFMSGYLEEQAFDIAKLSPRDGRFIAKPFTSKEIRNKVREEIDTLKKGCASSG